MFCSELCPLMVTRNQVPIQSHIVVGQDLGTGMEE